MSRSERKANFSVKTITPKDRSATCDSPTKKTKLDELDNNNIELPISDVTIEYEKSDIVPPVDDTRFFFSDPGAKCVNIEPLDIIFFRHLRDSLDSCEVAPIENLSLGEVSLVSTYSTLVMKKADDFIIESIRQAAPLITDLMNGSDVSLRTLGSDRMDTLDNTIHGSYHIMREILLALAKESPLFGQVSKPHPNDFLKRSKKQIEEKLSPTFCSDEEDKTTLMQGLYTILWGDKDKKSWAPLIVRAKIRRRGSFAQWWSLLGKDMILELLDLTKQDRVETRHVPRDLHAYLDYSTETSSMIRKCCYLRSKKDDINKLVAGLALLPSSHDEIRSVGTECELFQEGQRKTFEMVLELMEGIFGDEWIGVVSKDPITGNRLSTQELVSMSRRGDGESKRVVNEVLYRSRVSLVVCSMYSDILIDDLSRLLESTFEKTAFIDMMKISIPEMDIPATTGGDRVMRAMIGWVDGICREGMTFCQFCKKRAAIEQLLNDIHERAKKHPKSISHLVHGMVLSLYRFKFLVMRHSYYHIPQFCVKGVDQLIIDNSIIGFPNEKNTDESFQHLFELFYLPSVPKKEHHDSPCAAAPLKKVLIYGECNHSGLMTTGSLIYVNCFADINDEGFIKHGAEPISLSPVKSNRVIVLLQQRLLSRPPTLDNIVYKTATRKDSVSIKTFKEIIRVCEKNTADNYYSIITDIRYASYLLPFISLIAQSVCINFIPSVELEARSKVDDKSVICSSSTGLHTQRELVRKPVPVVIDLFLLLSKKMEPFGDYDLFNFLDCIANGGVWNLYPSHVSPSISLIRELPGPVGLLPPPHYASLIRNDPSSGSTVRAVPRPALTLLFRSNNDK